MFEERRDHRAGLAGFLLDVALRRARRANDVSAVRDLLRIALHHGLVDAPAPRQAVALLQRSALMAQAMALPGQARPTVSGPAASTGHGAAALRG